MSSITLSWNGTNVVCVLVNQDTYSSEYRYRDSLSTLQVFVRHTKSNQKARGLKDRHNIEITQTQFATATSPERVNKIYTVLEHDSGYDPVYLDEMADSMASLLSTANVVKLINWESLAV